MVPRVFSLLIETIIEFVPLWGDFMVAGSQEQPVIKFFIHNQINF
ncbi:MAG: hypothetical protein WC436_00995 [Candidatus Babeliales bacterium]